MASSSASFDTSVPDKLPEEMHATWRMWSEHFPKVEFVREGGGRLTLVVRDSKLAYVRVPGEARIR